jgi:hypothetical protein
MSSQVAFVLIIAGGFVALIGNLIYPSVREGDAKRRWAVFTLIVVGGVAALMGNSVYPSAREREAKERLAHDAKAILMPEIQRNKAVVADIQKVLAESKYPWHFLLEVGAWQAVSNGGLLVGLKPEETTKFLRIYSLTLQVNSTDDQLADVIAGPKGMLPIRDEIKEFVLRDLHGELTALQQAFSELASGAERE